MKITLRISWPELMVLNDMATVLLVEDSPLANWGWDDAIGVETILSLRAAIHAETEPRLLKKKKFGRERPKPLQAGPPM
jgi:hypothetical protein